jgi:hypothetical protein
MPSGSEHLGAGHEAATALIGPDGAFTLVNVPDGRYTILAGPAASGYVYTPPGRQLASPMLFGSALWTSGYSMRSASAAPRGTMLMTLSTEGGGHAGRVPVEVAGADRTGITVGVGGASISGRVELARREGASAQAFFDVLAEPAGGDLAVGEARGRVELNDPTRAFTIDGLVPGDYMLRVPPTVGIIRSVIWQGQDYSSRPFVVTPGQEVSAVVVTTTWEIARLQGIVRDAQGRPAARGAVMCFPVDPAGWRRYGPRDARVAGMGRDTSD